MSNHCQTATCTRTLSDSSANGVVVLSTCIQEEEVRPTNVGLYSGPGRWSGTSQNPSKLLMPWQHFSLWQISFHPSFFLSIFLFCIFLSFSFFFLSFFPSFFFLPQCLALPNHLPNSKTPNFQSLYLWTTPSHAQIKSFPSFGVCRSWAWSVKVQTLSDQPFPW